MAENLSNTVKDLEPEKEKNSPTHRAQDNSNTQSSTQSTDTGITAGGSVTFLPVYDTTAASDTPVSFRIIGTSGLEVSSPDEPPKKRIREQEVSQPPSQSRVSFLQQNPDGSRRDSMKGKTGFFAYI